MDDCPHPHKMRFLSRRDARDFLRRRRGKGCLRDGHVRAYLCGCGGYHLGRLPKAVMGGRMAANRLVPRQ